MIIFYNKKTGRIIGTVEGRVHDENVLKTSWIQPEDVLKEDIGKYVVPFIKVTEEVEIPVKELRVIDKTTMKVEEVIVGKEKVKKTIDMEANTPFKDSIRDFETGKKKILEHKVVLDKKGNVIDFEEFPF